MNQKIRVVIVDDHQILLDGLSQALDSLPDLHVVHSMSDGSQLAEAVEAYSPDVLLVDVEMPGTSGLSAISQVRNLPPTLIVTMHTAEEYGAAAREAGAVGFLSKSTPLPELAAAIRAVAGGTNLFEVDDPTSVLHAHRSPTLSPAADAITERERDVLHCLVRGISRTEDLADELFISHKTVKNHLASIYEKLGVNDRTQAVVEAMKLGLDRSWE